MYKLITRRQRNRWLMVAVGLVVFSVAICWADRPNIGSFTDARDGRTYRTVVIGGKTWMAENLNFGIADSSWCYNNEPANCEKYGRLYTWDAAMSACPAGWRLFDLTDWYRLARAIGGRRVTPKLGAIHLHYFGATQWEDIATKLKSQSGWNNCNGDNNNGTDDFGLSALPGGVRDVEFGFVSAGVFSYWWTAEDVYWDNAAFFVRIASVNVFEEITNKNAGLYVRCVR